MAAQLTISFPLLLLLSSFHPFLPTSFSTPNSDFIKAECQATHYPALCVQCLSNYTVTIQQNHLQLAQAAISVSLSQAQSAATFISNLAKMRGLKATEYSAVQDCMQNIGGSVDQLSRSLKELTGVGRQAGVASQYVSWHVANAQTWVSSALTYEYMCLDSFGGAGMDGKVKVAIRRRVVDCAQVTSNALALVNRYAARHNNNNRSNNNNNNNKH